MRRKRKNAWPGFPRLHSKAARRGWRGRRSSRRTRRNAGSIVAQGSRAVTRGFHLAAVKKAGVILYGNISTTWLAEMAQKHLPMLNSHPALDVISVLGIAGLNAFATQKLKFASKYSSDIFIGGMLAGATRALRHILPGHFSTCGLGEDLEGLSNSYYATFDQVMHPIGPNGYLQNPGHPMHHTMPYGHMGAYAGPGSKMISLKGVGDEAIFTQLNPGQYVHQPNSPVITLDGMGDAEEMAGLA